MLKLTPHALRLLRAEETLKLVGSRVQEKVQKKKRKSGPVEGHSENDLRLFEPLREIRKQLAGEAGCAALVDIW